MSLLLEKLFRFMYQKEKLCTRCHKNKFFFISYVYFSLNNCFERSDIAVRTVCIGDICFILMRLFAVYAIILRLLSDKHCWFSSFHITEKLYKLV